MSDHTCTQRVLQVYNIDITYTITVREGGADKSSNIGGIAGGVIVAIIAVLAIVGIAVCIVAWLKEQPYLSKYFSK